MKILINFMIIGLLSLIITSCSSKKGKVDDYPKDKKSNTDQITGMIISQPCDYDTRLGYKLAIDENHDGVWSSGKENYAWMPNDMYYEIKGKDSIIIKAVRFYVMHALGDCNEYIIFDWERASVVKKQSTKTTE